MVVSEPAGAVVQVDGQKSGVAPTTLRGLLPGDHLVEARWADGATAADVAKVTAGTSTLIRLKAPAGQKAAPLPPPPPPPAVIPDAPQHAVRIDTVDASASSGVDAKATVLKDPVLNPLLAERRRTWGLSVAPHLACQLVLVGSTGNGNCGGGPRLSLDFHLGKIIFDLKAWGATSASGSTSNFVAGGVGLELGSPFLQLGAETSPVSIAIRGVTRVRGGVLSNEPAMRLSGLGRTIGLVEVTAGLGTTLAFAISHGVSLQAQAGLEAALIIPVGVTIDFSSWLGLRFAL